MQHLCALVSKRQSRLQMGNESCSLLFAFKGICRNFEDLDGAFVGIAKQRVLSFRHVHQSIDEFLLFFRGLQNKRTHK